jgi:MerR family copper efflux transcriptional regulator
MNTEGTLTIGQLAKAAGVGVETLRFYERRQLITEPPRRASGYRQYPASAVARIRFIKRAKELGFSLKEIDELLSLRAESSGQCAEVYARAQAKVEDISSKIASLKRMKEALTHLAASCSNEGTRGECPILEALEMEP